jgi:hypothetical protein
MEIRTTAKAQQVRQMSWSTMGVMTPKSRQSMLSGTSALGLALEDFLWGLVLGRDPRVSSSTVWSAKWFICRL